ncbi:MAG: hypothetical protein MJ192_09175 [Clostridia bacterium]|nr:hypothetical protein [Clostridia bacterium]
MPFYLTAEGGGSKLLAVLYDENYNIINTARTTGSNLTCRREEDIIASMEDVIGRLIRPEYGVTEIIRLDQALLGCRDMFDRILSRHAPVRKSVHTEEGRTALAANECRYGLVAQSGTGSDAFLIQPGLFHVVGGWGPHLGDEGSGYDIGLMTIRAVIYAQDGRGPATLLTELLKERFGYGNLWEMVGRLLNDPDMRRTVASCSLLCSKAAHGQDEVALDIYRRAADSMADQVLAALRHTNGRLEGPVVTSGGAWKGHPSMFKHFCERIHAVYPDMPVTFPKFEPVAGPVFLRMMDEGLTEEEADRILTDKFACFLDPNFKKEGDCR